MDFGVARLTTASMTGTGNIVGTADYMSPEQVKGAKVDGRSDLFSVGCMLFELLTGRRPFHADNLMAIFYKITHEEPDFDQLPPGREYEALMPMLYEGLAKDLDDRYQTAYEFAVDLREYLKRHAAPARRWRACWRWSRPRPSPAVPRWWSATTCPRRVRSPPSPTSGWTALPRRRPATGLGATAPGAVSPTVRAPETRPRGRPPPCRARRPRGWCARPVPRRPGGVAVVVAVAIGAVAAVVIAIAALLVRRRPGSEPQPPPSSQAAVHDRPPRPRPSRGRAEPTRGRPSAAPSAAATPVPAESRRLPTARAGRSAAPSRRRRRAARLRRRQREAQARQARRTCAGSSRASWRRSRQLVGQADAALAGQKYDAAINLYNDALKLDPQNARALQGGPTPSPRAPWWRRAPAARHRAPAQLRAGQDHRHQRRTARRRRTRPTASRSRPTCRCRGPLRPAPCPARSTSTSIPPRVKAGDPYKVRVYFVNEGNAPIQIREWSWRPDERQALRRPRASAGPQRRAAGPGAPPRDARPVEGGHDLLADGGHRAHRAGRDLPNGT